MSEPPDAGALSARRRRGAALVKEPPEGAPLAVLSTFNLDLLPPFAAEALDRYGVGLPLWQAGFGQLAREIADPSSELYALGPRAVLLAPSSEDLLEPVFHAGVNAESEALLEERVDELRGQVETLLERLESATVLVACLGAARAPAEHMLAPGAPARGQALLERFDAAVRALGELSPRVIVVDVEWHARRIGRRALTDPRLWYLGRMRLNPQGLALLAELVARHLAAHVGAQRRKVAVVDLDDTLWGGIVGEAGVDGLALGGEGVGLAFTDFQRELLKLHDAGVVLAICTKNEPGDAEDAFRHPGMVLRREHFAAERINWRDKAANLREIAEELSLGLDALVFLDDNPVERDWVRQALPDVLVPELPADPVDRPAFLAEAPWFQTLAVTAEDRGRAASYRAQGGRRRAQTAARSFEDFLASLQLKITLEPVSETTLSRAAQLCQRTNQFNLTTRRHTVADLEAMLRDDAYELHTVAVRDRYGDSGVTGVAILAMEGHEARVDTLLLSCRVLGRRVEDALLAVLARRAKARGAQGLTGAYEPTARNGQVADFYPRRGFAEAGERTWRLDLAGELPAMPSQLAVVETAHA